MPSKPPGCRSSSLLPLHRYVSTRGYARDTERAMSQENVEVVQAAWAAWERNGLAGFTEYWADDIDWRARGGRWRGKDAGRAYLQELLGSFDEVKAEPIEFIDAGDQRVITVLRYSGREKRTGIEVPPEYFALVNEVRNGKMVTGREYATRKEALEAAGLPE
jgi:ketosteroid isomerase-like protein